MFSGWQCGKCGGACGEAGGCLGIYGKPRYGQVCRGYHGGAPYIWRGLQPLSRIVRKNDKGLPV